jgi:hypothetical protein
MKMVIFNNFLIIKEPRMFAFAAGSLTVGCFGEISPKHPVIFK